MWSERDDLIDNVTRSEWLIQQLPGTPFYVDLLCQGFLLVDCFDILILENIWILQGLACLRWIYDQINLLNMFLVWVCSNALKRFIWNQNQIIGYVKSDFKIRQFKLFLKFKYFWINPALICSQAQVVLSVLRYEWRDPFYHLYVGYKSCLVERVCP